MLNIGSTNSVARLTVDVGLGLEAVPFTFDASTPLAAVLLCERVRDVLFEKLRTIRQEAYEQGWADAKAKRAKLKKESQLGWWG